MRSWSLLLILGLGALGIAALDASLTPAPMRVATARIAADRVSAAVAATGSSQAPAKTSPKPPPTGPPSTQPPGAIALGSGWSYLGDPSNVGVKHKWGLGDGPKTGWKAVSVPNDFNPTVTPTGDKGTVGWYRTSFTGPTIPSGRAWTIAFESVRRNATAWLNGVQIGQNHDPYAPFSVPASSLKPHQQNTLIVRDDNFRGYGSFPEDWWNWGGIIGPVTLQQVGRLQFGELGVTPELGCGYKCGDFRVRGTVRNRSSGTLTPRIVVHVTAPNGRQTATLVHSGKPLKAGASVAESFPVTVSSPQLWSPSRPALYKVTVDTQAGSRTEQTDQLSVGMRSVKVSAGILYLNGQRLWLHGASIHEDLPGRGAAITSVDIDTIVSELKSAGANITRAHYQLSPRLLDALDKAGIMVYGAPPIDHADNKLQTSAGRTEALSILRSTLIEDRNHPSVIIDSIGTELSVTADSVPGSKAYITQAIGLSRQLNPGIPVALDIYCYPNFPAQAIYQRLDVIGIDDYYGWDLGSTGHSIASFSDLAPYLALQHSRYPNQALVISEFGAEAFYDAPPTAKGTYQFQSGYLQQTYGVLAQLPFMNGSLYWTLREFAVSPGWVGGATLPAGYAPNGIHHKGLISYAGAAKPAFAIAQQLFGTIPGYVNAPAPAGTGSGGGGSGGSGGGGSGGGGILGLRSANGSQPAHAAAPQGPLLKFCASNWCSDGPGGHLPPNSIR